MELMGQNPAGWRIGAAADNVIFLVGYGDWGESEAHSFCTEYMQIVESFGDKPWAVMGDATDWILEDPVVQDLIMNQNRWIVDHGCRAGCFYTGPGALNRLLLYRLAIPDSGTYRFRVYPHRGRALEALESSGFSVTDKQLNSFFRGEGKRA